MTDIPGDCTDHRALYARGLVDQSAILEIWGLHRPPSTIRSETGRPVCQFGDLGTSPTTEHYMPGDWSTSLLMQKLICKHKGLIPDLNVKACHPI